MESEAYKNGEAYIKKILEYDAEQIEPAVVQNTDNPEYIINLEGNTWACKKDMKIRCRILSKFQSKAKNVSDMQIIEFYCYERKCFSPAYFSMLKTFISIRYRLSLIHI